MKKIKFNYLLITLILFSISFNSCRKDDGIEPGIEEEPRDKQQEKDADTLLSYLNSHYYNSEDFVGNPNPSMYDLEITKLADGEMVPDGHTLLVNAVDTYQTIYADQEYDYYILHINQGGGEVMPHLTDDVRINYEGSLVDDGEVFDSTVNPTQFDLAGLIPGWSRVIPKFNIAESYVINGDGTVTYNDAGVGAMFLPSGLGYYSAGTAGIGPYKCLVFKFDLLQTELNDHDADGIPSYVENLDGDEDIIDDDTDEDSLANFVDQDDDGDGVLTIDELMPEEYTVDINIGQEEPTLAEGEFEISRTEVDGVITIKTVKIMDSNNDNLPDYLDKDITINYNED
ncbi:MAG: hypothetical protein R2785_04385 [Flavobacteriaceae bacterium]